MDKIKLNNLKTKYENLSESELIKLISNDLATKEVELIDFATSELMENDNIKEAFTKALPYKSGLILLNKPHFPLDYFKPWNENITYFKANASRDSLSKIPAECIITTDGTIYSLIANSHLVTSFFLYLNGIDLSGSILYRNLKGTIYINNGFDIDRKLTPEMLNFAERAISEESQENIIEILNMPKSELTLNELWKKAHAFEYISTKHYINYISFKQAKVLTTIAEIQNYNLIEKLAKLPDYFGLIKTPAYYLNENKMEAANTAKYNLMNLSDATGYSQKEIMEIIKYKKFNYK